MNAVPWKPKEKYYSKEVEMSKRFEYHWSCKRWELKHIHWTRRLRDRRLIRFPEPDIPDSWFPSVIIHNASFFILKGVLVCTINYGSSCLKKLCCDYLKLCWWSNGNTSQIVKEWSIPGRLGEGHSDIYKLWKKSNYEWEAKVSRCLRKDTDLRKAVDFCCYCWYCLFLNGIEYARCL